MTRRIRRSGGCAQGPGNLHWPIPRQLFATMSNPFLGRNESLAVRALQCSGFGASR